MIRLIKKHLDILLIIFLGLTPVLWFESGYIIAKGDIFVYWSNSINTLFYDNFVWELMNGGEISRWPRYNIFATIWYLLQKISISTNIIQIFFQIFYILGAGLAMYFLTITIYKKNKIAQFIASIFYMFNFFMLIRTLNFGISWTLVFLPVLLAFYIRIIDNIKYNSKPTKNIIAFAITSTILMSLASMNPPLLALIFIANFIVFIYYFISEKNIRLKTIQNLFVLFVVVFLINLWWLIPFLEQLFFINSGGSQLGNGMDVTEWSWTHARASFLNLFWLNGTWSWRPEYIPYIKAYSNPIMKFIVFIPMLIAFSGLLFKNNYRNINLYFTFVILFLMFLAKGLHPPFENINLLIYKYIPGFFLFRNPFPKFYMVLVIFLALLIGSSSDSIVNRIQQSKISYKRIISITFVFSIITVFLISAFPLITGDVITKETKEVPFSSYIKIPDYWYQSTDYINNKPEDFKILVTPDNDYYQMPYKWGYYGSDSLPSTLITKPILQQQYGYVVNNNYNRMITPVYDAIKNNSIDNNNLFNNLLAFFNIKYILQRNDIWWNFDRRKITSPADVKSFLSGRESIQFEKQFGELDIYTISDKYYLPHIYTTPTQRIIPTFEHFFKTVNSSTFIASNQNIIISSQNKNKTIPQIDSLTRPHAFFQKINPTKYKMKIEYANQPFWLVFSESYHPDWQAYINTDTMDCNPIATYKNVNVTECQHEHRFFEVKDLTRIFSEPIPEDKHFIVNGYANAWYIDPQELGTGENFTITLYFKQQYYFYIGLIISCLAFSVCMGYLMWYWRKKRHNMKRLFIKKGD